MKINQIVIASKNEHKTREIERILAPLSLRILSLNSFDSITDVEETGNTFAANAILKAKYYHQLLNQPVISDDSGLVVPGLNGEPGIYSARYAGEHGNYQKNNEKLIDRMSGLTGTERQAYFVCVAVYKDDDTLLSAEGRVYGEIISTSRGTNGFGYDPIFFYPPLEKTFAELPATEKNKLSHRYQALQALTAKLTGYFAK
jgi:XTP/dITP diphosphohydrolase